MALHPRRRSRGPAAGKLDSLLDEFKLVTPGNAKVGAAYFSLELK
jgi:hypothetical protein